MYSILKVLAFEDQEKKLPNQLNQSFEVRVSASIQKARPSSLIQTHKKVLVRFKT